MARAAAVVVVGVTVVTSGGVALAQEPLFVDEASPVPVIVDGTASFATHGRIDEPGGQVGVDVVHRDGEVVTVAVLVPDRPPEADRATHDALEITVTSPTGLVTTVVGGVVLGRFEEPTSSTSYLRVAEWSSPAEPGTYRVRVIADVPSRVVLVTGVGEQTGEVVGYQGPGVETLTEWYETPAGAGRAEQLDEARGAAGSVDGGADGAATPPATRGASPDTGAGQHRDVIGRSAGWPVLAAVLGLMGLVSVLALRPWRRRT